MEWILSRILFEIMFFFGDSGQTGYPAVWQSGSVRPILFSLYSWSLHQISGNRIILFRFGQFVRSRSKPMDRCWSSVKYHEFLEFIKGSFKIDAKGKSTFASQDIKD